TVSTQVTQGLLQQFPNLKGIISPTTVGIAAAAAILDTPQYRGKIKLTGLGTPNSLRKYVKDGTIIAFELWNPADLGYLAAYAAVNVASGTLTGKAGQRFTAGRLGKYKVGAKATRSCCRARPRHATPASRSSTRSRSCSRTSRSPRTSSSAGNRCALRGGSTSMRCTRRRRGFSNVLGCRSIRGGSPAACRSPRSRP